ncbi:MAG: pirin family protein [Bacteroidia bacterium]|nr:pirin family protein [Bacteroidia bacterium]
MKKVKKILAATDKHIGNGNYVRSPLPNQWVEQISPFLMLDHFGPAVVNKEKPFYVPPHPHKGFEPVTLLFKGEVLHHDSMGNTGHLRAGDVQWMTAGSGIVHSEGVPPAFLEKGGELELIQLWVNLPKSAKQHAPRYQDLRAENFPIVKAGDAGMKLLAGTYDGQSSPAELLTPVLILHGRLDKNGTGEIRIPQGYNSTVYTLKGLLSADGYEVPERQLIWYHEDGDTIRLEAKEDSEFVVLAGQPIHEPLASYGPFVMNSKVELIEALEEYRSGKMGVLEA